MGSEQSSRFLINNILQKNGWIVDPHDTDRNVVFEAAELEERHKKKLGGKSPDYILFEGRVEGGRIIGVLEAKNPRINLDQALEQAVRDAKNLGAHFAIAANGTFCKTCHISSGKPLVIDGEEVREVISYKAALKFVHGKSNFFNTIPPDVIRDRKGLLKVFGHIDNYLWEDNIDAGLPRFMEFANLLFLKLMGEKDGKWYWQDLREARDKIDTLNGIIIPKLISEWGDIFEKTKIKKSHVFDKIFEALDVLHLTSTDSDVKGDAFEYFLQHSTATKNDLGQYFTPRNIVKTMVQLVSPTIEDKVYDPFCGTGGFLTEAFNYIRKTSQLNEEQFKKLKKDVLFGKDASQSARIAKMNAILHEDGHSGIEIVEDTLSKPVEGKYSVGLTNIPFSQNKKNYTYTKSYESGLARNNGDAICILHLFKAIQKGGRMAAVVPEGFLFRKELATVRRFLTDNADLKLIISLPQGVFLPYTGVKTDIIYFENIHFPQKTKHFWYFNVQNDGRTLNNHRRKIEGHNDLDTLKSTNIEEDSEEELIAAGYSKIPFEKIRQNHENWIGRQYAEIKERSSSYSMIRLDKIVNLIRGVTFKKDQYVDYPKPNFIGVATTRACQEDGIIKKHLRYIHDSLVPEHKKIQSYDILISMANSLDLVGRTTFINRLDQEITFGSFMAAIRLNQKNDILLPQYLFSVLNSSSAKKYFKSNARTTTNISNLSFETLCNMEIPLPPLSIQQEIVEEIDSYRKIIEGAKQVVQNWKPKIEGDKQWEFIKLNEAFFKSSFTIDPHKETGFVKYIGLENIESDKGMIVGNIDCQYMDIKSLKNKFMNGDILLGKLRPNLNKVWLSSFGGICSTDIYVLKPANQNIIPKFYYYYFRCADFNKQLVNLMKGIQLPRVAWSDIEHIKIPLPPLEIQKEMVERLEENQTAIEWNKKLIKNQEDEIKKLVDSIWQKSEI